MSPKFFYVYIITNLISGKKYVGSKICYKKNPEIDGYMGSSKFLNNDIKIYGVHNFSKQIIQYYEDGEDLLERESEYIEKYKTLFPNGYNRFIPNQRNGFNRKGIAHSEETIKKMKQSSVGKNLGRILSEEHKERISISMKGKNKECKSEETKNKISEFFKGKSKSEETKNKIREFFKGKHRTEETKNKIKESHLKRNKDIKS